MPTAVTGCWRLDHNRLCIALPWSPTAGVTIAWDARIVIDQPSEMDGSEL